jgi:hypothetical protein
MGLKKTWNCWVDICILPEFETAAVLKTTGQYKITGQCKTTGQYKTTGKYKNYRAV